MHSSAPGATCWIVARRFASAARWSSLTRARYSSMVLGLPAFIECARPSFTDVDGVLLAPDRRATALHEHGIVPHVTTPGDSLTPPDHAEATACLQSQARVVPHDGYALKHPDAVALGRFDR